MLANATVSCAIPEKLLRFYGFTIYDFDISVTRFCDDDDDDDGDDDDAIYSVLLWQYGNQRR